MFYHPAISRINAPPALHIVLLSAGLLGQHPQPHSLAPPSLWFLVTLLRKWRITLRWHRTRRSSHPFLSLIGKLMPAQALGNQTQNHKHSQYPLLLK